MKDKRIGWVVLTVMDENCKFYSWARKLYDGDDFSYLPEKYVGIKVFKTKRGAFRYTKAKNDEVKNVGLYMFDETF